MYTAVKKGKFHFKRGYESPDGELYSFFNLVTRWGGWSAPRPGRFTPGKVIRYPLYRRLGKPHGRSRRLRKISPPPGSDPRTVHSVASRYADYVIPARMYTTMRNVKLFVLLHYLRVVCDIWSEVYEDGSRSFLRNDAHLQDMTVL
jgi:hypothetical protein